jgi:phosphoglycolate phosphatase
VAILESSDKVLIESAVQLYRERFSKIGLYENTVYANVTKMLDELRALSCNLFVATSKAEIYAEKILRHFSLDSYFTKIHGSDLEGRFDDKSELLRELIKKHNLNSEETIMIGDRKHDAIAAKKNGILSLGVTYGYGSREELEEAKVDCICENPLEIATFIRESWKYQITAI